MTNSKGGQNPKNIKFPNPLEALKDIGSSTTKSLKDDLVGKMPEDFMDQIFGPRPSKNYSGELTPGESLEFTEILSGQHEERVKLQKQVVFERRLREEEQIRVEKRTNELKIQLKLVMDEVVILSKKTEGLAEEAQIAAMQAPAEPGVYHLIFFEKLLEFLKSFRKKIDEAAIWLHSTNKRAQKKNYWSRYKKHGGKFLLSADHYLQRSAG